MNSPADEDSTAAINPRAGLSAPATALAFVIMLFSVLHTWNFSEKTFGLDFYQFWVVGREIGNPDAKNIYSMTWRTQTAEHYRQLSQSPDASAHEGTAASKWPVLGITATPLLYTVFWTIASSHYAHSLMVYQAILFTSGISAIAMLGRLMKHSAAAIMLMIAAMFGWSQAYSADIFCANTNQLQLLAIAVLIWLERKPDSAARDFAGGAWLATIVLFKPNLAGVAVLLAVSWLVTGQRTRCARHAIGGVVATIAIIVLTSMHFGSTQIWIRWLSALHEMDAIGQSVQNDNCSLAAVVMAHLGHWAGRVVTLVVLAAAVVTTAWAGAKRHGEKDDSNSMILLVAIGCALPLLAWSLAWKHYFVLATPLLLLTLRPPAAAEERAWTSIRFIVGIVAVILLCQSEFITEWLWLDDPASVAARLAGVTTAMFVLALLELYRGSEYHPLVNIEESTHASSQVR